MTAAPRTRWRPIGGVVAALMSLITATSVTTPAEAAPPGAIFCKAVARLVASEPVIGAVYMQSGAECAKSGEIEARIEARAFRDGAPMGTRSGGCARGHFWKNRVCEIPQVWVTNPEGLQNFEVKVTVKFTTGKNNSGDTITEASTSGRY